MFGVLCRRDDLFGLFFSMWSTRCECFSVGSKQPESIGLMDIGILCVLVEAGESLCSGIVI